ncbi:MAG: right-handed parallel beta-helix repeat-containing protein, partial [Planctomycetota bacterium]
MKKSSSFIVLALATFVFLPLANAQNPYLGGVNGGGVYESGAFRAVAGELTRSVAFPGRVWVSANWSDRGLGYRGSYLTAGMKSRLFEDFLDGRWLFEGRGHVSEEGGFFGNLGIERIFSVDAAGADISLGVWFDIDDDTDHFAMADTLESWGVSGKIKTRYWDLLANGYFPIGTSDTVFGDPTGTSNFFANSLVLSPGIDSGLQGFDVTVRTRPNQLAFVNGSFDFGGYGYESEVVEFFGGGRARLNFQMLRGMIVSGEINYDERFDVTGLLGVTIQYGGGNVRGHEYAGLARDLDRTDRNDHIVRFNEDVVLAIDPDTGAAYNVVHVDNTADAGAANGTFETPYTSLADAEANSGTDDIIFVHRGDGTTTNLDTGIVLQDGQLFLGDGIQHLIPIANDGSFGSFVELSNTQDGLRTSITADGNAVTLANRNTVRGFNIDGSASPGVMGYGVFGNPLEINTDGIIEDLIIMNAAVDGVGINNLAGNWTFARNQIEDNGFNGIGLVNLCDPTSILNFDANVINDNGLDGIQIVNYDAQAINFTNNETSGNDRDGVRIEGFKGDTTVGVDISFDQHLSQNNAFAGINVTDGAGDLAVTNSIIGSEFDFDAIIEQSDGGNDGDGIKVIDFTTPGANDRILISNNQVHENGIGGGAGINLQLNEGFARALITGNGVDANGTGLLARADDQDPLNGITTLFEINIIENTSFGTPLQQVQPGQPLIGGGSVTDGLRFIAESGATLNALVEQTSDNALTIFGSGGNGISVLTGEDSLGAVSNLNVTVRDVVITASTGSGVFGSVTEDGQLNFVLEDSTNTANTDGFNFNVDTNENMVVSSIRVDNVIADGNTNGFILNTLEGSFTDLTILGSSFQGSANDALLVNATGDADIMNPQIDNRTRLFVQGSTFTSTGQDGIDINASGDASIVATLTGNTANNTLDFLDGDGLEVSATGNSSINMRVVNNQLTGSLDDGFDIASSGTSTINAEFLNNNISSGFFNQDNIATNGAMSSMCLSFSNNTIISDNVALVNAGAAPNFVIELDGLSNGPGVVAPANS